MRANRNGMRLDTDKDECLYMSPLNIINGYGQVEDCFCHTDLYRHPTKNGYVYYLHVYSQYINDRPDIQVVDRSEAQAIMKSAVDKREFGLLVEGVEI